jgi:sodium transport system permease protein
MALQAWIVKLYPLSDQMKESLETLFAQVPGWQMVLLIVLVPAVCEELAFRGFILSGLRNLGSKWQAIIYSSLLFGLSHSILQQSILASLTGVILGFIAFQTGSILPAMIFHMVHNGLALSIGALASRWDGAPALLGLVARVEEDAIFYHWPVIVLTALLAMFLLRWFDRRPHARSGKARRRRAMAQAW